jgi:hypothetical protein
LPTEVRFMQKPFLLFILINNLPDEWHFHLRNFKSEDLGMSTLVNHPGFQEQRGHFWFFCNFPFILQTTGLWSWLHLAVNFCLEKCAQLNGTPFLFKLASDLLQLPSVGRLAGLIWCWGRYLTS